MSNLLPLIIVFGLALWSWAYYRLQRAAQPLRLELAKKGERLLGDPDLPVPMRDFVRFLLDTAFSNRAVLLFGIFYVPCIAFFIAVFPHKISKVMRRFHIPNKETRAAFDEVMRLHDRITLANHPILLFLLEAEILLLVAPTVLLVGILREVVSPEIGRQSTMDIIEDKGLRVRRNLHKREPIHV